MTGLAVSIPTSWAGNWVLKGLVVMPVHFVIFCLIKLATRCISQNCAASPLS